MKNKFNLFLIAYCLFFSKVMSQDKDLTKLANWLQGSYSSELQAKSDSDFFDIRLHIQRIWQDNKDGYWFYVEQAVASAQEKPYRQRVYHLTKLPDSKFESSVFTLPNPLRFAGEWKKDNGLSQLTPDSLGLRKGCSVFLSKISKKEFSGATHERDCESDLRGAKYASSKVKLSKNKLESWDQGFDAEGKQVWGSTKGAYQFIKE